MKAQVQTESLNNALNTITRLVPPVSGNVTLETKDGKTLTILAQGDASECVVIVSCDSLKAKKDVLFSVPLDGLRTAVRGRKEVELEFDKQVLSIRSGSFTANLNTIDAISMESIEEEGEKEKPKKWKMEGEQSAWLAKATKQVALQANSLTGDYMPLSIRLDSKRAFVTCYDKHHFAFLQSKEINGDLDLTLPIETVQGILDVFQGANFTIEMVSKRITVRNKIIRVTLAVPEVEEGSLTIDDVIAVSKEATKMKGIDITMPADVLRNFLAASKAVALKERAELTATGEGKKIKLQVQTLSGQVKESLPIEKLSKKTGFKVDYTFFEEATRKLTGENVTFKAVASEFLLFNSDNLYVMVSTNQES